MADAKSTLLLIPTSGERSKLLSHSDSLALASRRWHCELCGFGLVAAAAATMQAIQVHQPERVLLAGIAGGLSDSAAVGSAHWFQRVICDGIGVGEGDAFVSADSLAWKQWSGTDGRSPDPIGDRLDLVTPEQPGKPANAINTLVSVGAASADAALASRRRSLAGSPPTEAVIAEDMEAFGVAMACRMTSTPCMVVRGISNVAGDRDHSKWQIDLAIQAVAGRLAELV
ncbi:futalosine hydrolase [Rhodopirellula sp. P2]|uniref:futalosine hydrolase n=1 Tax=Rhodopirellula sp. P2 TaxID=2127060 RepID=UPI0023677031|nr:futalosine hydrolase [Rhodopirellula sp. P2]WDQ16105.1 futalosine hydrolase [Rhodopirellula sp. P2]